MRSAFLVAVLALGSCGYRFAVADGLPGDVRSVGTEVFANESAEPEAGAVFAQALGEALAADGLAAAGEPDARVTGTVLEVRTEPLATGPSGRGVGLYRVSARVKLSLARGGTTLCSREASGSETYLPARGLLDLEASRGAALRRLAASLMAEPRYKLCYEGN
jgi:hypothetical protein